MKFYEIIFSSFLAGCFIASIIFRIFDIGNFDFFSSFFSFLAALFSWLFFIEKDKSQKMSLQVSGLVEELRKSRDELEPVFTAAKKLIESYEENEDAKN